MGAQQVRDQMFRAVESNNINLAAKLIKVVVHILKIQQYPELLNAPLAGSASATALQRSAWRGDMEMIMLLVEMGADLDLGDEKGVTPLMWAAKRDHAEVCIVLIKSGTNYRKRSLEGMTALDYAVLLGNYSSAYMIYEFDKMVQEPETYMIISKRQLSRWVNYEDFVASLREGIFISKAADFLLKPPNRQFVDPVVDPRESWGSMIKRIINFEEPPMVERSTLPQHLQQGNIISRWRSRTEQQTTEYNV